MVKEQQDWNNIIIGGSSFVFVSIIIWMLEWLFNLPDVFGQNF